MSCLVDVSVLLGAAELTWPGHEACRSLLERLWKGRETWYLTEDIENDLHHYGISLEILERLRQSPSLRVLSKTNTHRSVMDWLLRGYQGLQGEDLRYVEVTALMREHGVTLIYTLDGRFKMFPFLEVVNPLHESLTIPPTSPQPERIEASIFQLSSAMAPRYSAVGGVDSSPMEVEKEVQRYVELLEGLVKLEGYSIRDVERRLGWGKGTLNAIFRGKIELKLRHLFDVLNIVGYTPEEFYEMAHRKMPPGATLAQRLLGMLDDLGIEKAKRKAAAQQPPLDDEELERRMYEMFDALLTQRGLKDRSDSEQAPRPEAPDSEAGSK